MTYKYYQTLTTKLDQNSLKSFASSLLFVGVSKTQIESSYPINNSDY